MLTILCPVCNISAPELEFVYAGQAHISRPGNPEELSDEDWRDYLFIRANTRGIHAERWRHTHGCARFFNVLRDTCSDLVLATYQIGHEPPLVTLGRD
ncbi:MAG TPA: sarcosine oxidase subunit delta [Hyphomonas sp.]|nr:sarcosine oxidase subunit delta [Hyphomonas sp.]